DCGGALRLTLRDLFYFVKMDSRADDRLKHIEHRSHYSFRSAVVGSNLAALRAGSHEAITAINKKSTATKAMVVGSVGLTSTSMLTRMRVNAKEASSPITIPITLR